MYIRKFKAIGGFINDLLGFVVSSMKAEGQTDPVHYRQTDIQTDSRCMLHALMLKPVHSTSLS